MEIIDLNNLSLENIQILQSLSKKLIKEHEKLVKDIYYNSDKSIHWTLNSLLSRDNYLSTVFKDICFIFFAIKIIKKRNIELVICQSFAQKKVLKKYIQSKSLNVKVITSETLFDRVKYFFTPHLIFYINIKLVMSFIYNSSSTRFNFFKDKKNVTLIDIFFIDAMFDNNTYRDRYYSNLFDEIPVSKRKNCFFLPTILINKKLKEKIRLAEKAKEQFLFIFDVLKPRDYLFALTSPFRIKRIDLNNFIVRNVNIGPILKADFRKNITNKSSFLGILHYLFFKSLKKEKIELRLVIDWFENQVVDRGFNIGKNKFFPNTPSIGYQGFTDYHDFHSHFIPTLHEVKTNQSPDKLALISRNIASKVKELYPYIDITLCPAFRFKYLYDKKIKTMKKDRRNFNVLLILPSSNSESSKLINFILNSLDIPEFNNIKWLIKPHPNRDINIIKKTIQFWSDKLEIINTSFDVAIDRSDLMVGNTSSTCMEALARGKPVIISCNNNFIDQNPIPSDFPKDIWAICNNSNEFRLAIKSLLLNAHIKKQSFQIDYGKKVLEEYFEPITVEGLNTFLNI